MMLLFRIQGSLDRCPPQHFARVVLQLQVSVAEFETSEKLRQSPIWVLVVDFPYRIEKIC